jgi:hypothetical protein
MTLPAGVCLAAFLLLRPLRRPVAISWHIVLCGLSWLVGGYALTLFLPVGSSLYACFPSIGAAMIAAEICGALWRHAEPRARFRTVLAGVLIVIALIPVYRARNHRWTDLADFSSSILEQFQTVTAGLPDRAAVVLLDDRATRVNLESAFGTLLNDAYSLKTGRKLTLWVEPPLSNAHLAGLQPPCPNCVAMTLQLRDGILSPVSTRSAGDRPYGR